MSINQADFIASQPGVNELYRALAEKKLSAQQADQQQTLEKLKNFLQGQSQQQSLERLQQFMPKDENGNPTVPEGAGMALTPEGASFSKGINYAGMAQKDKQGDAAARMKANTIYNSGLPKIQQAVSAASEGLDQINDPENPMSKGMFLGAVTRSLGLSRFPNAEEAKQILPPSLQSYYSTILNGVGDNENPLTGAYKNSANQFFKGILDTAAINHKMLKQNATGAYTSSPYANDAGMQALSGLGGGMDAALAQAASKYHDISTTRGPNLSAQPPQGSVDKLRSYLGFGGGSPSAPSPQSGNTPQGGFDPDSYLRGR